MPGEFPQRPLIFVAHPDDESLAFGGLLQRLPASLVVFATDGAPAGFGLERKFGSMKAYAAVRAQEVSRVFRHIPKSSFKTLTRPDGAFLADMHVFEGLPEAATCLHAIARSFGPDAIISHAYEGAHLDHDACSFLTMQIALALSLKRFEFPLYWLGPQGAVVRQEFRDAPCHYRADNVDGAGEVMEWRLTEAEVTCKKEMLDEYQTQHGTVAEFLPGAGVERMRIAVTNRSSFSIAACSDYMYQERRPRFYHTRRHRLAVKTLLEKFAEFEDWRKQQQGWASSSYNARPRMKELAPPRQDSDSQSFG